MAMRKLKEKNIRKLTRMGDSRGITIPVEMLDELGWREHQKIVVRLVGDRVILEDWEK